MKKFIAIGILALSSSAMANDYNVQLGFCGAYQLVIGNNTKASAISKLATNKEVMQQAARMWITKVKQEEEKAISIALLACKNVGVQ